MALLWLLVLLLAIVLSPGLAQAGEPAPPAAHPVTIATLQPRSARKVDPFDKDFDVTKVEPLMQENLENIYGLLEEAGRQGADIALAPEDIQGIASYGLYVKTTNPKTGENLYLSLIQTIPGPITQRLSDIARKHHMNVVAGMYQKVVESEAARPSTSPSAGSGSRAASRDSGRAESAEARYYNVAVVIDRQGEILGTYRKTHLPSFEKWSLTRGTTYPVFQLDCARVGVAICYDITFEECPRILALCGADVILHPTLGKYQMERGLADAAIYRARAMDNSVHLVTSEYGHDGSGIIDPEGKVVAERNGEANVVVLGRLDLAKDHTDPSTWWRNINGTDNVRALRALERHPETYGLLSDPHPPLLERYQGVKLVTEPEEIDRAYEAIKY
jgi:predicted amidohydrolase